MTGTEIKEAVQGRLPQGATIENTQAFSWINGAVAAIRDEYPPIKEVLFSNVEAGEECDLPADYMKIAEVRDGERYLYYNVTADKKIIFEDGGNYTVKYHYLPAIVTSLDENPDVPEVFHAAIVEFCLSKFWEAESEGAETGAMGMAKTCEERFYYMVAKAVKTLTEGTRITRRIRVSPWTWGRRR